MTLRCADCGTVYAAHRDDLDVVLCTPCYKDRQLVSARWPV